MSAAEHKRGDARVSAVSTPSPTLTKTYKYTRAVALKDQVEAFLRFGGIADSIIVLIGEGVRENKIHAVGLYACDEAGARILEASITVDWRTGGRLVLQESFGQESVDVRTPLHGHLQV
jgi:hypothetical protein